MSMGRVARSWLDAMLPSSGAGSMRRCYARTGPDSDGGDGVSGRIGLPAGRRVVWDGRVRLLGGLFGAASVVLGGAPWGVLRIAPAGRRFVRRLYAAGGDGLVPEAGVESAVADLLVRRGVAHPVAAPGPVDTLEVVVPAYDNAQHLDACLDSLRAANPGVRIIVVDDASHSPAVGEVAAAHGATYVRHDRNRGPAAARNTGLRKVGTPLVAFVDADCVVTPGWLETLTGHFDDPRVAAVAPRITARISTTGVLARYEAARSALDMGPRPQLVTHGAPLGYLPSAALVARRECLPEFDERLRLGEDVDLVWRLVDDGHLVRYEPAAMVTHEMRHEPARWAGRIFDYGTSAAELDRRHPGRLAPARLSVFNVAAAALLLNRHRGAALAVIALSAARLAATLRASSVDLSAVPTVLGKTLASDADSAGHLLRREWWPIGWLALAGMRRWRVARAAAAVMLLARVREWLTRRPDVDLPRYLALRLAEDAAYGSGVIVGAVRARRPQVLLPHLRLPRAAQKPNH
ncbi:MAG: mycofactocin system glycosyltransferase [Mycobacterium sp.]|nr:mycofactocin system glycosyltransferase [Mycobacterium sp.]